MTAEDALREMREIAEVDVWKRPGEALRVWADAIEAELKAKENKWRDAVLEVGTLNDMNANLHLALSAKDAEIARIKKRLTKYEGPEEPYE